MAVITKKIGKKQYETIGLVAKIKGKRLSNGVLIISTSKKDSFVVFLKENNISYSIFEIWGNDLCD